MRLIHPACDKWPRLAPADFAELVTDIKANGLINHIWLTPQGEILEGKNRYEACREAGVEPRFGTYVGDDPIGFTISQNKLRRHLNKSHLALIGEELANLQHASNRYQKKIEGDASPSTPNRSREEVAKQ